jgi:excisionase family DNA binding protein
MSRADLATTGELAAAYGVTRVTARKWITDGRMPAVRTLGGHYRVDRRQLPMLPPVDASQQAEPQEDVS